MSVSLAKKITPFPQTPIPENENQEQEASTSSTTTRARAREGAELRVWMDDIARYYRDTLGCVMPPMAKRDVEAAIEAGLEPQLVIIALDETALAPRPSWAYARAILRRLLREGVYDEQAYNRRQARFKARKSDDLPF